MSNHYTLHVNRSTPLFDDTVQLSEVMSHHQSDDDDHLETVPPVSIQQRAENMETPTQVTIISKGKAVATVVILLIVNLLNYMDRFTIAGVLIEVKHYYGINNSESGIIQTAFICTYMVCSPVFGYLGDRYTRKILMASGIFLWALFTLASSFIPKDYFWGFVLLRALVGVGEASYSTIAPTIIADLYAKENRTKALMVFYFAIPVGSGLGYIVGSNVASLMGSWQWALRVTPVLGVICVVLIILFCQEPPRGMSEGGNTHLHNTDVCTDIKALGRNKSFVLSTVGFTAVAFVTGALAFLAPSFMTYASQMQGNPMPENQVSLVFGVITVAAGFIGVAAGAEISRRYRRVNPRADPLVCAIGLIASVPFLFFAIYLSAKNAISTWMLIFIGQTLISINWAVTADILLTVVIPTRRSLAEAGQILTSHALGDAISPYIIGTLSDTVAATYSQPELPSHQFVGMQTAMYLCTFVCVIGGACYLATALCYEKDSKRAEKITKGLGDAYDDDDDDLLIDGADVNYITEEESHRVAPAVGVATPGIQDGSSDGGGYIVKF